MVLRSRWNAPLFWCCYAVAFSCSLEILCDVINSSPQSASLLCDVINSSPQSSSVLCDVINSSPQSASVLCDVINSSPQSASVLCDVINSLLCHSQFTSEQIAGRDVRQLRIKKVTIATAVGRSSQWSKTAPENHRCKP